MYRRKTVFEANHIRCEIDSVIYQVHMIDGKGSPLSHRTDDQSDTCKRRQTAVSGFDRLWCSSTCDCLSIACRQQDTAY